jgi:hypothetical protein
MLSEDMSDKLLLNIFSPDVTADEPMLDADPSNPEEAPVETIPSITSVGELLPDPSDPSADEPVLGPLPIESAIVESPLRLVPSDPAVGELLSELIPSGTKFGKVVL